MRRFLVPDLSAESTELTLDGDLYRHLVTVLRLKPGAIVNLQSADGACCRATISAIADRTVTLSLDEWSTEDRRSPLRIELYQGMPKGDKLELIIQKATELGVSRIIPFPASRSVTRIPEARLPERIARWQKIAAEAARQSGAVAPVIAPAPNLATALAGCHCDMRLIPWEEAAPGTLHQLLLSAPTPESIALLVGPEGGFPTEEVATARTHSFQTISLGPRILRTETAGLALTAVVQSSWGDLG